MFYVFSDFWWFDDHFLCLCRDSLFRPRDAKLKSDEERSKVCESKTLNEANDFMVEKVFCFKLIMMFSGFSFYWYHFFLVECFRKVFPFKPQRAAL